MKIENKSLAGVIWGLQAGLFATGMILGLGTIAAAFVLSNELASKLPIPIVFQHAASIIVTGLIWLSIDGTMGKNFYFAASYLKENRRKDANLQHIKTSTVRFILFFSIVQILISTTLSTITAFVLPTILIESPDDSQYAATLNAHNNTYNATISSIDKDISEAKRSEGKRITDAKKEGHQIVLQAISSGSVQNQKLYESGNNWFFTEKRKKYSSMIAYRERIQKAKQDSAVLVQKERGALTTLQNAKLSALSQTPDKSGTLAALGKSLEHKITTSQYLKATVSGTLVYIDVVAGILFTILTLLLVSFKVKPSNVTAMEVVFAGISNKSAAFWSRIGKALNVDVNNIHEIEFEVQQEAQKPLDPGSFNQKILVRGGGTDDIQIDILKRDIQNLKAQNTELLKSLSKSSNESNTEIDRIAKSDGAVTHAAESIQKKGHTENDTEKMSANLLINTGKKGQNKQTEAQQIAKFIKRFRERYKQGIVNKNTETRERNEVLAKKDWQYLEKRGYVINKNPDDKTKLIITKS